MCAAAVGGLLGALHGLDAIPRSMLDPVLAFDPSKHDPEAHCMVGYRRPALYRAANVLGWLGSSPGEGATGGEGGRVQQ